MRRTDFIYLKRLLGLFLLGGLSFIYLGQRMSLIKQIYSEAKLKKSLKMELLKKESLISRIAALENPALLEQKFFSSEPNFNPAKSVRVVKIPYIYPRVKNRSYPEGKVSFAEEIQKY